MVELSSSPSPPPTLDASFSPEPPAGSQEEQQDQEELGRLKTPQTSLEVSTAYHGYETYIENGLICLKHKVRNLEKKKVLKLMDYKRRLGQGEELNKDQMAAVEKYEEVIHNLEFVRELHRTLDALTQSLLKAQKKAVKKEQMVKMEAERRHLTTVLQLQHLLTCIQQEHVQKDLLAGRNQAPYVPAPQLNNLIQLAALLGIKRDGRVSLDEQMEQAAGVYMDLLEGKDQPVAGSTYKLLKDELSRLLKYKYFSCVSPPTTETPDVLLSSSSHITMKSKPTERSKELFKGLYSTDGEKTSTRTWKEDFQALREQEPPDSWEVELLGGPLSPQTGRTQQSADSKPRKERRAKVEPNVKLVVQMEIPAEVCSSPPALPKDPRLRKQHLEDFMTQTHSSFSFMQDSLLDGENLVSSGTPRLRRRSSGAPSPQDQEGLRPSPDVLPKMTHSTPLPPRLMERKVSVTKGDQNLLTGGLDLSSVNLPCEPLQLADETFSSPTLYHRESPGPAPDQISPPFPLVTDSGDGLRSRSSTPPQVPPFSTPPIRRALTSSQLQNIQSVFSVGTVLPQNGDLQFKSNAAVLSGSRFSTASTQTPPEFAPPDDDPQLVYQSDYRVCNGGQVFLSPNQSGGGPSRAGQSYYPRGSLRGMARGGRGPAQTFRSHGWHRGGPNVPQAHHRDAAPLFYAARDSGYQQAYRRGGGIQNCSAAWSDSSQVSSPDRDGACTVVDSGHGDSMSVSTVEVPLTPHSHPPALLPMQLYPLSQPLRVAFTASRTANFAPGNLDQPIVFDQLHSNLGEMYDTHIGRFTCPVNGTYVFIFHILKLAINVPLYVNLMCNEEVMVSAYANDGAPDHETASNHAILPLFQGDQVWLRLHRGAIYGSTWKYSTFSGFLLYQD